MASTRSDLSQLAIVACHFNPCGYAAPIANWWRWRGHLPPDVLFCGVELSFDGRFHTDAEIRLRGTAANLCWQKEALLNVAIRSLPRRIRYVAWIDADILFEDAEWASQAVRMLRDEAPLVQLFSQIQFQGADRATILHTMSSAIARLSAGEDPNKGSPGGAWAARRDCLASGLYWGCIVGTSDAAFLQGALGLFRGSLYQRCFQAPMVRDWLRWAARFHPAVRGRIGRLPGTVTHLHHGDRKNRQYGVRYQILNEDRYDPERHVQLNAEGVVELTPEAPARMRRRLQAYFEGRREDE